MIWRKSCMVSVCYLMMIMFIWVVLYVVILKGMLVEVIIKLYQMLVNVDGQSVNKFIYIFS